ncbi:MAG: Neurotransmitter-gated ion-channel ligand binding domain protein [Magnetococcales bacterium]|nr:Neurotransmitter-gated ion-channel ligand binding domain protein [Magnetococcales bacterium]
MYRFMTLVWLLLFLIISHSVLSDESVASDNKPEISTEGQIKIKVGIFVTDIYGINFFDNYFITQFWVWFIHSDKAFTPKNGIELPSSRKIEIRNVIREVKEGVFWDQVKYEVVMNNSWNPTYYPFDHQRIKIYIEVSLADTEEIILETDDAGTKISSDVIIPGWTIGNVRITSSDYSYSTTFGDPEMKPEGPSRYSRVTLSIGMKRMGWRLLFNDFIGFYFSIALAGSVLIINSKRNTILKISTPLKITLGSAALFSAVGASYVLQSKLPMTTQFTLADSIQLTAFGVTALSMISSIIIENLLNENDMKTMDGVTKLKSLNKTLKACRGILLVVVLILLLDLMILAEAILA